MELPHLCEIHTEVWRSLRGTFAKNQSRAVASTVSCSDRSRAEFLRCIGTDGAGLLFSADALLGLPLRTPARHANRFCQRSAGGSIAIHQPVNVQPQSGIAL